MARKRSYLGLSQASGELNPLWGAAASAGVGTGASALVRATSSNDKHAELIGTVAGAAIGGAMLVSTRTRAAGVTGLITVFVTQGLRTLEGLISTKAKIKNLRGAEATYVATKATVKKDLKTQLIELQAALAPMGLGIVRISQRRTLAAPSMERRTLAAPSIERRQLASNANLGLVSPEVVRTLSGAPAGVQIQGVRGSSNMPQLVGGLGGGFGATLFGGN